MAVVFSLDLSWLSPLLIFVGVVRLHLAPEQRRRRRRPGADRPRPDHAGAAADRRRHPAADRIARGAGAARRPAERDPARHRRRRGADGAVLFEPGGRAAGRDARHLGRDPGRRWRSAWCSAPTSAAACSPCWRPPTPTPQVRRLPLGNLIFKAARRRCSSSSFLPQVHVLLQQLLPSVHQQVVAASTSPSTSSWRIALHRLHRPGRPHRRPLAAPTRTPAPAAIRPRHLDPLALTMPSLAISCAAREALHQADVVETMLRGILPVIRNNDLQLCRASCASSTTPSTSSTRRSSST